MGFATNAIHVGQEPDPATGAIVAPIYQTSTYVNEELGKNKGYDYARTNHPNRKALERTVAKLEGGHSAYVFTSGMAGIDAVFRLLRPGDITKDFVAQEDQRETESTMCGLISSLWEPARSKRR